MSKRLFFLIYLINPFIALISAVNKFRSISLQYVLMLFCAFYGTTQFTGIGEEKYKDSSSYKYAFYKAHGEPISWDNFKSTLLDGETTFDLALPVITYAIAIFTGSDIVFFAVFGLIFGFFYGRNIQFMLRNATSYATNRYLLYLVLVFALVIPFWSGLNGLRMWIAAHIFFYGSIRILTGLSKKYWWFVLLSLLFHFSFLSVATLLAIFVFTPIKKYKTILFVLFVSTLFVTELNVANLAGLLKEYSPAVYKAKVEEYTKDIYVETFSEAKNHYSWHARLYGKSLKFSLFFLTIVTFVGIQKIKFMPHIQGYYFSFALLLLTFSNVFSTLPSGGRFYSVAYLFALVPISYIYPRSRLKKWFHLTVLPLLFWMVVNIRDGFDHITLATILSNPLLTWLDFFDQAPLITFIK